MARNILKVKALAKSAPVHGDRPDDRYKLSRVRYVGRMWVRVWAIRLPARPSSGRYVTRTLPNGARYTELDRGAPERLFVRPCKLFPKGGLWPLNEGYQL